MVDRDWRRITRPHASRIHGLDAAPRLNIINYPFCRRWKGGSRGGADGWEAIGVLVALSGSGASARTATTFVQVLNGVKPVLPRLGNCRDRGGRLRPDAGTVACDLPAAPFQSTLRPSTVDDCP